jgi:tRNA (guanine-N7-)-methyltransferase
MQKLSSQTLPWPVDWPELFGADRPLILEIGFGRGTFLLHLAHQNPGANIVGLEISNRCLVAAENAATREKLDNIRIIHSTAETALHHLFQPASISQIHINFPDPWFKSRHSRRRLMQRDTLDLMVNRLHPGGLLYLATDIYDYAAMSSALLAATPNLENLLPTPWGDSMPGRIVTKYESTARREGRDCYYFAYRRNDLPALDFPVLKDLDMPHMVFQSPLTIEEVAARFERHDYHSGGIHVMFNYVYRGDNALLFDVYVKEPTIDQRFALMLTPRKTPGEFTLQLGPLGHPRPTEGVHKATSLLGDWLARLHPNVKILKSKLQGEDE